VVLIHNPKSKAGTDALISALEAREPAKKLHILVNNSGVSWGASFDSFPEDKGWDNVMAVNVKSLFYCESKLLSLDGNH
jgi:NAD(P)-dependent dehydrogenase (short-subunit alcohol dehydrogenase family)